jgi:3-oxoacyl-[acyl-carrier-protein] synthase-3
MTFAAGIKSIAVALPEGVRKNDYYRERFPDRVAALAEKSLGKLWSNAEKAAPTDAFSIEMAPYLDDPFRGTVERRIVGPGETALSLEKSAAERALRALGMTPNDVDLMIVSSFQPDQLGVGNASFLARALGMKRPAWNLESACSSSVVALHTACGLVAAGQYSRILVVASCTYSRNADDGDSVSWFLGDGAGAFVVGREASGRGLLGMHTIPTTETCDTFYYAMMSDPTAPPRMVMQCTPSSGKILLETAEPHLLACAEGAARAAGVRLAEIDFLVCNTPTAWFSAFAARALGIDPARTVSTFPRTGNIGCALMPANLHAAAGAGRIAPDALVLLYSVGSVSTASAAVLRWGDVALGPAVL